MSEVLSREHQQLAVMAALKTFVLLKNLNGMLPVKKSLERLAVGSFIITFYIYYIFKVLNWY